MARPIATTTETKLEKNPLNLALGAYFSHERLKIAPDNSSKAVANLLDIGESLYRMIESGNARVHPKNVTKFIQVFGASHIDFDALCKLLIAIQFLDVSSGSVEDFDKAITELKDADLKISILLNSIHTLIKAVKNKNDNQKEIANQKIIIESIHNFLSNHGNFGKQEKEIKNERIERIFKHLPTLYYDLIDNFIDDLLNLPMGFRANDLKRWEDRNVEKENIKSMYAIVKYKESIISDENFKDYKYKFLWDKKFQQAHMVFITDESKNAIENEFKAKLFNAIKDNPKTKESFEKAMDKMKISVVKLSEDEGSKIFAIQSNIILHGYSAWQVV
jgi:hypothetical protein